MSGWTRLAPTVRQTGLMSHGEPAQASAIPSEASLTSVRSVQPRQDTGELFVWRLDGNSGQVALLGLTRAVGLTSGLMLPLHRFMSQISVSSDCTQCS